MRALSLLQTFEQAIHGILEASPDLVRCPLLLIWLALIFIQHDGLQVVRCKGGQLVLLPQCLHDTQNVFATRTWVPLLTLPEQPFFCISEWVVPEEGCIPSCVACRMLGNEKAAILFDACNEVWAWPSFMRYNQKRPVNQLGASLRE